MSKTLESGASGGEGECEGDGFNSVLILNFYQLVLYIFCLSLENTNSLADRGNSHDRNNFSNGLFVLWWLLFDV